jgi:hypothetical protein
LASERTLAPSGHSYDKRAKRAPTWGDAFDRRERAEGFRGGNEGPLPCKSSTAPAWSEFRVFHFGVTKLQIDSSGIHVAFACGPSSIVNGKNIDEISCAPGTTLDSFHIFSKAVSSHKERKEIS